MQDKAHIQGSDRPKDGRPNHLGLRIFAWLTIPTSLLILLLMAVAMVELNTSPAGDHAVSDLDLTATNGPGQANYLVSIVLVMGFGLMHTVCMAIMAVGILLRKPWSRLLGIILLVILLILAFFMAFVGLLLCLPANDPDPQSGSILLIMSAGILGYGIYGIFSFDSHTGKRYFGISN